MTAKSAGFGSKTIGQQPPLKYWAMLTAIRAVLREGDPDIADALFQPTRDIPLDARGRRIYARGGK